MAERSNKWQSRLPLPVRYAHEGIDVNVRHSYPADLQASAPASSPLPNRLIVALVSVTLSFLIASCRPGRSDSQLPASSRLVTIDLSVPSNIQTITDATIVHVAKNGWSNLALRVTLTASPTPVLKVPVCPGLSMFAYQVLPAAVDYESADYIRQTGDGGGVRSVPRVLLPLPINDGEVDLSSIHDPARPANLLSHPAEQSVLILLEIHATATASPGVTSGELKLLEHHDSTQLGKLPIQVNVENLDLGDEPSLTIAAPLIWDELAAMYPDAFEAVTPRLLSRRDAQHTGLIDLLGRYISLAHDNGASAYVPRLQPIVKWPPGLSAEADWGDFDSIVSPWLKGTGFADGRPIGFWPLPEPDSLAGFDAGSRSQYWRLAAEHFQKMVWPSQSPVIVHRDVAGEPTDAEALNLSIEARQILLADPRLYAWVPLHDDQLQIANDANPDAIPPASASRLVTRGQGLIYPSLIRDWPADLPSPRHWIEGQPPEGSPNRSGYGNEQDIRTLAALAFLHGASIVQFENVLPKPNGPTPAGQITWFYPGEPYGVDHPLPTLQLKWLRQASQDLKYFQLGPRRDDVLKMCRLIARTVQLLPAQSADPVYSLLVGCTDSHASEYACRLIADAAADKLHGSLKQADPLDLRTIRWLNEHQRPTLIPAAVRWTWPDAMDQPAGDDPGQWIDAAISVDLYNPAEEMPNQNQLQWSSAPLGWQVNPHPQDVAALPQFQVHRVITHATFNLDKVAAESSDPMRLTFIDGFNGDVVSCNVRLPVAISARRRRYLRIDGSLDDWDAVDAIQLDQPLVRMLDRPTLQLRTLRDAETKSSLYSAWSDDNFYLAFRLAGVATSDLRSVHNFVDYQAGRAWGEDLCEVLIQPVYADNAVGPTLHIVAKPGGEWVERKSQGSDMKWEPFEAGGIRYAAGVDSGQGIWRGELAIPWQAIASDNGIRPSLLRFNFIQHRQTTDESASWAGPIDQSRDGAIAGLIQLRESTR